MSSSGRWSWDENMQLKPSHSSQHQCHCHSLLYCMEPSPIFGEFDADEGEACDTVRDSKSAKNSSGGLLSPLPCLEVGFRVLDVDSIC
jgi:hypothetical protein